MKTIEQQKSELCDKLYQWGKWDSIPIWFVNEYNSIDTKHTESTNPYIDEVFDMRICNVISDILNKEVKKILLSDCPHISKLDKRKNIGFGSIQAYEVAMRKYGLNDKLI